MGLVLQLFSCFTGDESAMELWLLLSSAERRRPAVAQTCRQTDRRRHADSVSPPTVHVHHPRRRAVLRSRQLGAVLLVFALLLVLVLLQTEKKKRVVADVLTSNAVKYKHRHQPGGLTSSDLGSVTGTHL